MGYIEILNLDSEFRIWKTDHDRRNLYENTLIDICLGHESHKKNKLRGPRLACANV